MQWKNRKKALWIVVTLLVLSIIGLLIIRAQITKKQSNDYVNWFSNKISQVELQQIPIAYVGNNAIYEEDIYAYALLHSIDVAYHEGSDPEEIYQSCSVLQDSFLKLLQNEIYVVYAEEIGIEMSPEDATTFIDKQNTADLQSDKPNQKATAVILNQYYTYFAGYNRGLYARNLVNQSITELSNDPKEISEKALELYEELVPKYEITILNTAHECLLTDDFIIDCAKQGFKVSLEE